MDNGMDVENGGRGGNNPAQGQQGGQQGQGQQGQGAGAGNQLDLANVALLIQSKKHFNDVYHGVQGCVKLGPKMLTWKFMGQVAVGIKAIPKAFGPESFANVPKYPELDPGLIFKVCFVRHPRFRRYFPDRNHEDWGGDLDALIERYGKKD